MRHGLWIHLNAIDSSGCCPVGEWRVFKGSKEFSEGPIFVRKSQSKVTSHQLLAVLRRVLAMVRKGPVTVCNTFF